MKVLCIIQCTPSDLYESIDPDDYCISALKQSNIFDNITLAVAKLNNYSVFDELSKEWGVDVYYGSSHNVAERLYSASVKYNTDVVVRVLLKRFYIDIDLVKTMIDSLNGYDYVNLDNNVNYEVAADVMSFKGLERVVNLLKGFDGSFRSETFRFSPWAFMEAREEFKVFTLDYREMWDKERIKKIKVKLEMLFNRRKDERRIIFHNRSIPYKFMYKFIEEGDVVLDYSCGQGGGTKFLSERASIVYGIDYNEHYINAAKKQNCRDNIEYFHGTDELMDEFDVDFDKIVSLHTIEHLEEDEIFFKRASKRLKKNGKLILEAPRLMPYPLGEPLYPFHLREYKRAELEQLIESNGFEIEIAYGGNRGDYLDIEDAREVLFYVCKKI